MVRRSRASTLRDLLPEEDHLFGRSRSLSAHRGSATPLTGLIRRVRHDDRVHVPTIKRPAGLLDAVGLLIRLGLAVVWLVSGAIKVADPAQFATAVHAYRLFGPGLAGVIAGVVPFVELVLGALLVAGLGTRLVAVVSAVLFVAYIAGVVQAWARGLTIDCGCFGGGGQVSAGQTAYGSEIARDVGFLAMAVWLAVRPRTPVSADGWLQRRVAAQATREGASE